MPGMSRRITPPITTVILLRLDQRNVYSHYGDTSVSGTSTWYSKIQQRGWGEIQQLHNFSHGCQQRTAPTAMKIPTRDHRREFRDAFDTASGTSGDVDRNASYNAQTPARPAGGAALGHDPGRQYRESRRAAPHLGLAGRILVPNTP